MNKQTVKQREFAGHAGELPGVESLSERQLEVGILIGYGLCTKDIADALGLSTKTVEYHRLKVYKHTGAQCQADVTRLMMHAHLIE